MPGFVQKLFLGAVSGFSVLSKSRPGIQFFRQGKYGISFTEDI